MIQSFLWRLILQLVNTPKHRCRTTNLLAGLFCKGDCWWGTGLWYNKNSESVAEFMTAGSEFFKRRSHLAWYQARLIPVLLHWFKTPHTFDSLVLMRLVFFLEYLLLQSSSEAQEECARCWEQYRTCWVQPGWLCVGGLLSGLMSPCCCVQLWPLGVVA